MANEKRLIEVKTAWKKAQRIYSDTVILHCIKNVLDETPTVDAVEVVRCKDCKYSEWDCDCSFYLCLHHGCDWNDGEHFCSYGERRTEDG